MTNAATSWAKRQESAARTKRNQPYKTCDHTGERRKNGQRDYVIVRPVRYGWSTGPGCGGHWIAYVQPDGTLGTMTTQ